MKAEAMGLLRYLPRLGRTRLSLSRYLFLIFIALPTLLYLFMAYIVPTSPALIPASLLLSKRPMLVVAHPDDESLFFGPTILRLTQTSRRAQAGEQKDLRILVLSSGNNYGKGSTRQHELQTACERINAKECLVLDNDELKDNPKLWWKQEAILPIVTKWVDKWKADAVITFDEGGVSGHINHRAVSSAISSHAASTPSFPPTFLLRTVPTFFPPRKYIGIIDLPLTCLKFIFRIPAALLFGSGSISSYDAEGWRGYEDKGLFVSTWGTWRQNVNVFWAHSSQRSWDRWLYMLVSRYMWFNDVFKVERVSETEKWVLKEGSTIEMGRTGVA